jgi:uncharacterized membrane protein YdbT with pleckstrin-like domain
MGSYVSRVLQPDETVRHLSKISWIIFIPGAMLLVIGIAALVLSRMVGAQDMSILLGVAALAGLFGFLSIVRSWFKQWTTEIAVTNRRIIYKRGFIRRRTVEMNMDKVESVDVDQSIAGRLFGYGTVVVRGTGGGMEPLYKIDDPLEFRSAIIVR